MAYSLTESQHNLQEHLQMLRYKFWSEKKLEKLQKTTLFREHLLPDIKKGNVFPAIRKNQVHFYYKGKKIFGYTDGGGFQTNVAFAVALDSSKKGEVKERDLTKLTLIPKFESGYEKIKKNIKRYTEPESLEVSKLCKQFSIAKAKSKGQIVVLDVELSLKALEEDRSQDRIDLVMLNNDDNFLRFFEVKLLSDARVRSKEDEEAPEVVAQLNRYNGQVSESSQRETLLKNYQEYISKLEFLLGIEELNKPAEIDPRVDLLLFGYKTPKAKEAKSLAKRLQKWGHFCSLRGSVGSSDLTNTLKTKWWDRNLG